MEAQQCKARGITNVAFLNPDQLNETNCKYGDNRSVVSDVARILLECQDKESILLTYNCRYVFPGPKLGASFLPWNDHNLI